MLVRSEGSTISSFQWSPLQTQAVPVYASISVFPASGRIGDLAIAADTGFLYEWNGSSWMIIAGGSTILTVGTIDSTTASANGAVILSNSLIMQSASATVPGLVNLTTQSFAGNKTFTGSIAASNFSGSSSGTNTGDLTLTAVGVVPNANAASLSGQVLTLQPANTSFPGVLLAADWNTFNNKQPAGNYITALTGDATASGPGSVALTLATVNGNVGSFGTATQVGSFTVNAKGLVTAASNTSIQIAESQVTNLVTDLASKVPKILESNTIFYTTASYANLQAAVDAAELLAGSAITNFTGVTILIPVGDYSAQSVVIRKHINLVGLSGVEQVVIGTITYRPTSAVAGPRIGYLRNLFIQNINVLAETAAASGIFYPDIFDSALLIENCTPANMAANRINSIRYQDCYMNGLTATYTYCSNVLYFGCKSHLVTWHSSDAATNPPTNGSAGALYYINSYGAADMFTDGGSTNAFIGVYNSYIEFLTLNGNCDVACRGGGSINKDNLVLLNSNNVFVEHESYGMYGASTPANWASEPSWIRDALDQLAGDRVRQMAAVGAVPNANGASISGNTLTLQPASASFPGVVTTGTQTLAGAKTFSTAPILSSLTASTALVLDGSKNIASLAYASANTASALVQRDGSGNFSAGTITAALTGTASGNTTISGQTNHGVVVASAGNSMTSTTAGTASHVLTSNGASADPTFQAVPGASVTTQTANYTVTTSDTIINCITNSFNVTLPTAVSFPQRLITINLNTAAKVITLLTTSSQTIGGYASGVLKLATKGDSITLYSDNANWQIVDFNIEYYFSGANTAGTSINNNSTDITVPFATENFDNQSNWATDTYTVVAAGQYEIMSQIWYASATYAAANRSYMGIQVNGSTVTYGNVNFVYTIFTGVLSAQVWRKLNLVAGDTIKIVANSNRTAGATALDTGSGECFVEITRVGN